MVKALCPICQDAKLLTRFSVLQCGHTLCTECLAQLKETTPWNRCHCPVCRSRIARSKRRDAVLNDGRAEDGRPLNIEIDGDTDFMDIPSSPRESPHRKHHMRDTMRVMNGLDNLEEGSSAQQAERGSELLARVAEGTDPRDRAHQALLIALEEMKTRIAPMFKQLPELEAKLAALTNENDLLNDSLRQATASNRTLKHEKKALDKQVTTAENIGREALEATEAVNAKLTSTRQELKATTRERDEVKAQLERITQERDEARLQTTLYKKKYLAGKKKLTNNEEAFASLTDQLEQARQEAAVYRNSFDSGHHEESLLVGEESQMFDIYPSPPTEAASEEPWPSNPSPLKDNPRHTNTHRDDRHHSSSFDFEGMPKPGFASAQATSTDAAKKRKNALQTLHAGPSKKHKPTNPLQTDAKGAVKGVVAVGKKYSVGRVLI